MPKTIQQFIDEYDRINKNLKEAEKEEEVLASQMKNLLSKNGLEDGYDMTRSILNGEYAPSHREFEVWNKLNPSARKKFSYKDIEVFRKIFFDDLDYYVKRDNGVDNWWRGLFNQYKTLYDAWGNRQTWGINNHPDGHFKNGEKERNAYMLGALYADNFIGSISAPFLDVRHISGDGIGDRADTQYSDSYRILSGGLENARIIRDIAFCPQKIVYLNETQEVKNLQEKYRKNKTLNRTLKDELKALNSEKYFLQPEKLELIKKYNRISGVINNLILKVTGLEENQKAQKNLTDTFFKGSKGRMSMRDELMSQSESLQQNISNLNKNFNTEKNRNEKAISSINTQFKGLSKNFVDLKSLYSVNESKLKEDSNLIKGDISTLKDQQISLNTSNITLGNKISGIQKEMDENSRNYALEKEKIFGEIEGLRKKGNEFIPAINDLNSKLANLTKAHDLTKNSLLDKMKSLEKSNQTRFDEIETKNEDFKNRYNKNTEQLQRDLGFVRAGINTHDRDIDHLADEAVQVREAFGMLEKQNNVKFKTLFEYNAYTNRQIQKQNTRKLTTLGNIKKAAQPDLLKKAFNGLVRGRFFDDQPILY